MEKAKTKGKGNKLSTKLTLARQAEKKWIKLASDVKGEFRKCRDRRYYFARRVRDYTNLPVVAYNVSGEYAMIKAAGQ